MSGYVRIHRPLFEDHPAFRNDAEAMAFAWLIVKAQWQPKEVRYKGRCIKLRRGQAAVSVRDFARAMDRDKAWVERLLKRLRDRRMIETVRGTATLVITICNYNEYQADAVPCETPRETANETDARQTRDTEQVREEVKKESSEAKATSPRWACPPGVDPLHWTDFRRNRKTKRLTDSETAYRGQLRELEKLADDEWPPGRLVQHAAEKGWGSICDPRNDKYGQPASNVTSLQRNRPNLTALLRASSGDPESGFGTRPALPASGNG